MGWSNRKRPLSLHNTSRAALTLLDPQRPLLTQDRIRKVDGDLCPQDM